MIGAEAIIRTLRAVAWQRAKGNLAAMLETYHSSEIRSDEGKYAAMDAAVREFVAKVEESGWSR